MKKFNDYSAIEITGYDRNKGYLFGKVKDGSDKRVTLVQNKQQNTTSFIENLSNPDAKTFAPVGSTIIAYGVQAIRPESGFYSANYAVPLNKHPQHKKTYSTPLKIDGKTQVRNNEKGQFKSLGATALDANYETIHNIQGLRQKLVQALRGSTNSVPGYARGVMIRIGQRTADGTKKAMPFEFFALANETPEAAIERLYKENDGHNKFRNTLKIINSEIKKANSFVEISGLSRLSFNSYGNPTNLEKIASSKHYKTKVNGKARGAYSLTAIAVNNSTGQIDTFLPLPRAKVVNDISGIVGAHSDEEATSFNLSAPSEKRANDKKGVKGYPLRMTQELNTSGQLSRVAIKGSRSDIAKYKDRIISAGGANKPFYRESDNSYVFPISISKEVGAVLSDLTGEPAIYIDEPSASSSSNSIYVRGRTESEPFRSKLKEIGSAQLDGKEVSGGWAFNESKRITLEALLGDLIKKPLNPVGFGATSYNTSFPSYAEWQKIKYNDSPNALLDAHFDALNTLAEEAGIDWTQTSRNIIVPPPNSSSAIFKSNVDEKSVEVLKQSHQGSASVVAASSTYRTKNKKTGKEEQTLSIYLKFINKKMGGGEFFTEFKSGEYDFSLFEKERGTGNLKKPEVDSAALELRELDNQKRLEERALEIEAEFLLNKEEALVDWNSGSELQGNEKYISDKGLTDYTSLIELRAGANKFNSTYSMYQLVDEWNNFVGLQKIYDKPWVTEKGKNENKTFTKGTKFTDSKTNQPIGTHGRVGFDDGTKPIIYTEGMADALSSVAATDYFGKIGLNKDNLKKVVSLSVHNNPDRKHIVIGDNDKNHKDGNIGAMAALDAAWENNVFWLVPDFTYYGNDDNDKDINDLHRKGGLSEVRKQIENANPPPKNLVEYYKLRLQFESAENLAKATERATAHILERYSNFEAGVVKKLLEFKVPEAEKSQQTKNDSNFTEVNPRPLPPEEVEANTVTADSPFPIEIIEKTHSISGKKYLVINDPSNGIYSDPIAKAIEECMPGKTAIYNDAIGQYIAPFHLKNLLNSKLHSLTGAPANYIGKRYRSNEKGFGIRGDLPEELVEKINLKTGFISTKFSQAEQGLIVEDELALYLIQDILDERLLSSNIPKSFDAYTRDFNSSDINYAPIKRQAEAFGVSVLEIVKIQTLLSINEEHNPRDDHWFAALIAKTKKEHEASGQKLTYEALLDKAYFAGEHLLTNSEMTEEEYLSSVPLWYQIGKKYKLEERISTQDGSDNLSTNIEVVSQSEPTNVNDFGEDTSTGESDEVKAQHSETPNGETAEADQLITEPLQAEQEAPLSLEESNENASESDLQLEETSNTVHTTPPAPDEQSINIDVAPQSSMFDLFAEEPTELSLATPSTIQTPPPVLSVEEVTSEGSDDSSIGFPDWEIRIRKLHDAIDLLVSNGFEHDEFIELVENSPASVGYEEGEVQSFYQQLASDLKNLKQHPIADLGNFTPLSLSSAYFSVFNRISAERLEGIKDYIAEFVYIKGAMVEKTFNKYLSGKQSIPDMVADNPYFIEGELQSEVLLQDIEHLTDFKSINDFYRHYRDIYSSQQTNNVLSSDEENEPSTLKFALNGESVNGEEIFSNDEIKLYALEEGDVYLSVDAHGTITELKHERFKSTKNDEVLLNKLYLNGRSAYVVSFENITKGFLEFDKAQSFYSRNENKLLNLTDKNVTFTKQPTRPQIEAAFEAYYDDGIDFDTLLSRLNEKYGVTLDSESKSIVETAFKHKTVTVEKKKLSLNEKLSELISVASEQANTGLNYTEFFEETFKEDGYFYNRNPFLESDSSEISRQELNQSLSDAGYKSLKAFYNSIYETIHAIEQDEIIGRLGGFIPSASIQQDISLSAQFTNLINVLNAKRLDATLLPPLPFKDYAKTPHALQNINAIQSVTLDELTNEENLEKYSLDDYLLLADLHHVQNVSAEMEKATVAQLVVDTWSKRRDLTFLSTKEIADFDSETLNEFSRILGVSNQTGNLATAIAIKSKLKELRELTSLKLAQFNYISDAIQHNSSSKNLPAFVYRDIDLIANGHEHNIDKAINYVERIRSLNESRLSIEKTFHNINLVSPEVRAVLKNSDTSKSYVVGIEDAKYASHAYLYSLTKDKSVSDIQLPLDISYYTVVNDKMVGFNRGLDNDFVQQAGLSPISDKALERALAPIESFIGTQGYLALKNNEGNAVLIRAAKKGFVSTEYNAKTLTLNTSSIRDLSALMETYRAEGYEFSGVEPLFDVLISEKNKETLQLFEYVTDLDVNSLSEEQQQGFTELLSEDFDDDFSSLSQVAKERIKHALQDDLIEKITGLKNDLEPGISENYKQVIRDLLAVESISIAQNELVTETTESVIDESPAGSVASSTSDSDDLFNHLDFDQSVESTFQENDSFVPSSNTANVEVGRLAIANGRAGIITEIHGSVITIEPVWKSNVSSNPSAQNALYSSKYDKYLFELSPQEFASTEAALSFDMDVDLFNPRDEKGLERIQKLDLSNLKKLSVVYGADVSSNDREVITQELIRSVRARTAALLIETGNRTDASSEDLEALAEYVNVNDGKEVTEFFRAAAKNSKSSILNMNYEKAIEDGLSFGYHPGISDNEILDVNVSEVKIISDINVITLLNKSTIAEILKDNSSEAEYIKYQYLSSPDVDINRLETSSARIKLDGFNHTFVSSNGDEYPSLELLTEYSEVIDVTPIYENGDEVLFWENDVPTSGAVSETIFTGEEQVSISGLESPITLDELVRLDPVKLEDEFQNIKQQFNGPLHKTLESVVSLKDGETDLHKAYAVQKAIVLLQSYADSSVKSFMGYDLELIGEEFRYSKDGNTLAQAANIEEAQRHVAEAVNNLLTERVRKNADEIRLDGVHGEVLPNSDSTDEKGEHLDELDRNESQENVGGTKSSDRAGGSRKPTTSDNGLQPTSGVPPVRTSNSQIIGMSEELSNRRRAEYSFPLDIEDSISGLPKRIELNLSALKLSKQIEDEDRLATHEEKNTLALYSGWGGMPGMFDPTNYVYIKERRELMSLVTGEEYESIKASALTAFYTPPSLIEQIHLGAEKLGFAGGEVSDPSTGTGGFISAMPAHLKNNSTFTARELDTVTGKIAQQLFGENIVKIGGYENATQPNNYFDLVTSNIPFGNFSVYDSDYAKYGYKIHDYFMVKSIDKVKPGGLVAFMTSTGTLDKVESKAREHVYKTADLVAAIRMPSNTFTKYANTNVASDIIFLRKRLPGEVKGDNAWLKTQQVEAEDRNGHFHEHTLNSYFVDNPEMIVGELTSVKTQFGQSLSSKFEGDLLAEVQSKIENIHPLSNVSKTETKIQIIEDNSEVIKLVEDVRPGSFVYKDGKLGKAVSKYNPDLDDHELVMEPLETSGIKAKRLISLISVRDACRAHIQTQLETEGNDPRFLASLNKLNEAYERHVQKHGVINATTTKQVFQEDPDYPLLLGLESIDKKTKDVVKAQIFTERTVGINPDITKAESLEDALFISIAKYGEINPTLVSQLLDKDWKNVVENSGDLLFLDPNTDQWMFKGNYLSGNISTKLKDAKAAAELNPYFEKNVKALESVMPQRIISEEIKVRLGTAWIPASTMSRFVEYIVTGEETPFESKPNRQFGVSFVNAEWSLNVSEYVISSNSGRSRNRFGTERRDAVDLIEKVMNGSKTDVFDTIDGKAVFNAEASALASAKAQDLATEFKEWVWKNPQRKEHLEDVYNERFNVFVNAKYDGSHIQYTGLNPNFNGKKFDPRQTQKNTLMRYLVEGRALLAHGVGTGKSFELASIAIEGKARGVHQKPMVAVPNNVFGQLSRMIQEHYPNARILALDPKNMPKEKRKEQTARIATGNWDAIIVAHSTLDKFSAPTEFVTNQLEAQLNEYRSSLENAEAMDGQNNKRAQRKIKNLENKIQKRLSQEKKDNLLYLDELGIDTILVDEADNFLNLGTPSNMGHVNGVNTQESNRAMNMIFMTRFIQELRDGKGVVWATGTDIRKSMSDLFVNLYVLAPDELKALGVYEFDNFMSVFGEVVSTIEANPEGTGYRENSRLAKFNNLPELGKLYRTIADVVTAEMAGVEKPNSNKIAVKANGNEYFDAFMKNIAKRATSFRNGSKDETWFSIQHDSQRAAMDMRCIDPNIPESPSSKIMKASENILSEFRKKDEKTRAQLVFIDRFVNPSEKGFSVYDDLINKLVAGGIPREKIIDSRQVNTEAQKKEFEDGMNSGKYAVAIGTTDKFGVGNNIQQNLVAMHELTPPWNPRDLEQRLGRIERHGNQHSEVNVYRYSTENSFDLFMWETMKRKATFIMQTKLEPELAPREYTEEPDATYTEMMAIATGNSLIKDKIDVDSKLKNLERQYRGYIDNKRSMVHQVGYKNEKIEKDQVLLNEKGNFLSKVTGDMNLVIDGMRMPDLKSAGERVKGIFDQLQGAKAPPLTVPVGEYNGMEIKFRLEDSDDGKKVYRLKIYPNGKEGFQVSNHPYVGRQISDISLLQEKLENVIGEVKDRITFNEKSIESLKTEIERPFEKEEEMLSLQKTAEKLNAELLVAANEASKTEELVDWGVMLDEIQRDNDLDNNESAHSLN